MNTKCKKGSAECSAEPFLALRLVDHGDGAGHAAGTVGIVDIVVARRGDKLLIRVERELTVIIYALIVAILIIFVL